MAKIPEIVKDENKDLKSKIQRHKDSAMVHGGSDSWSAQAGLVPHYSIASKKLVNKRKLWTSSYIDGSS